MPDLKFAKEGEKAPAADLSAVAWLQGHWRGEAFGGVTEEVWSAPLGGSMMGAFKLVVNGEVQLYELETISEEAGSLVFRLRHFHSDLKGWEEKDEFVAFNLVQVEPGKVWFDGLTVERVSDNDIRITVAIENDGKVREERFDYQRVLNGH
ncbi:MAG: hypothetical protein KDI36_05605 [Pseudomonadales bacterium]|nr:hypothetical protein [Pseudomonadales bacterium]